jgi:hypothetical protein
MSTSILNGRRIHITGSISEDSYLATKEEVTRARQVVEMLIRDLIRKGATFVIPVDAERFRNDGCPICFDWLIWRTIKANLHLRSTTSVNPMVIAVKHHKNENQIPGDYVEIWDELKRSELVQIENVSHWNMNSKRMEAQARHGDILLTIGGSEGVLFLANLYHDAGKPVIPVNFKVGTLNTGTDHLFKYGLQGQNANRLFRVDQGSSHTWLNRIDINGRKLNTDCVSDILDLMENLVRPKAFVVRLLDPSHPDFNDVQDYFDNIVQPVIEGELGYRLTVIDGAQAYEFARIDEEIFKKLHRSSIVIADITGARPNCFIELGYALGRGLPTLLSAKDGMAHPFDITTLSGHRWKITGATSERRNAFRTHWNAIKNRPALVSTEPLIP